MKIGYRVRDNRDMYWQWFRHSNKYHYGVWGGIDEATTVYSEKDLKTMLRDIFKTIRVSENIMTQVVMATGIVVEEIKITEDIQKEHNIEVTTYGDKLYWDGQKFTKEFKRSPK